MRKYYNILLATLLIHCSGCRKSNTITFGNYSFDFPADCKQEPKAGDGSYAGKIKGNSLLLTVAYANVCDKLVQTPKEYLDSKDWLIGCTINFYEARPIPVFRVISIRELAPTGREKEITPDYIASIAYDSVKFECPIYLPDEIKGHYVKIDTIQHTIRKIVIAKNPSKGITGIYLHDTSNYAVPVKPYPELSITASNISKAQQDSIVAIFSTLKINSK